MSQKISSTNIIPESDTAVKQANLISLYDLGRALGDAVWQQSEGDADAVLGLSEVFCTLLALPDASQAFLFVHCLCRLLGIDAPLMPPREAVRHYVEAVHICFSEALLAWQEDILP